MDFDWSVVLLILMVSFIVYICLLSPTSFLRSHKDIMRHMREKNARKGITMHPGWVYKLPGGKKIMSRTGKEKDAREVY